MVFPAGLMVASPPSLSLADQMMAMASGMGAMPGMGGQPQGAWERAWALVPVLAWAPRDW